ncbi:hypothetical protein M406DRAFT_103130 [Cryphonectria parasitica EP155]|uniref:Uncharacterized protein n=1 Tax=Cryphonectria parasitica (strain ATCC 38755 / EP155) TaxID=660469 RepID=A0A9P4XWU1_CRYP1|nr:uncharacterized protein M406DRAFT_103130 [Cryphonectria parasitica EP155]KAF3762389.1 hypothetical protein M406DRAFT_103130 [Cryphonectria parasitica EP155]
MAEMAGLNEVMCFMCAWCCLSSFTPRRKKNKKNKVSCVHPPIFDSHFYPIFFSLLRANNFLFYISFDLRARGSTCFFLLFSFSKGSVGEEVP